jgi:hypothetical protein
MKGSQRISWDRKFEVYKHDLWWLGVQKFNPDVSELKHLFKLEYCIPIRNLWMAIVRKPAFTPARELDTRTAIVSEDKITVLYPLKLFTENQHQKVDESLFREVSTLEALKWDVSGYYHHEYEL